MFIYKDVAIQTKRDIYENNSMDFVSANVY